MLAPVHVRVAAGRVKMASPWTVRIGAQVSPARGRAGSNY